MQKSIATLLPSPDLLLQTLNRFSLTLLLLVIIFFVALAEMHNIDIPGIGNNIERVILSLVVSTGLSISIAFIGESRQWRERSKLLLTLVASVGVFIYYFFTPHSLPTVSLFILAITGLLILTSPSLIKGDDASFWLFNRDFYLGTFLAGTASILFALAILMALLAVEKLFGVKRLVNNTVGELWLIIFVLMIPIYALSWAPTQFRHSLEDCKGYPALNFAINWLLIPIALIYLIILYAYFGKIAITQELPKSILSGLIIGFSVFGIVIYMISWPMIKTSSIVSLFSRWFFTLLIIPTGFLWYSISIRVGDYGITEQRYIIISTALWISLLVILSLAKQLSLRIIPASLLVILLIATFSPFNAFTLSKNSQEYRLEKLLEDNNLLIEGLAVKTDKKLAFETRKNISAIIEYLLKNHDSQKIKQWFSEEHQTISKFDADKLTNSLGFKFVYKYQRNERQQAENKNIYFYAQPNAATNISDYDWHSSLRMYHSSNLFRIETEANTITVFKNNKPLFSHSFVIKDLKELQLQAQEDRKPIEVLIDNDQIYAKLVITRINVSLRYEKAALSDIQANIYYRLK